MKTAKELIGKRVTLKGELEFLDGKVGKDGQRIPRQNRPFNPETGEIAIVVSEIRPADSPKEK